MKTTWIKGRRNGVLLDVGMRTAGIIMVSVAMVMGFIRFGVSYMSYVALAAFIFSSLMVMHRGRSLLHLDVRFRELGFDAITFEHLAIIVRFGEHVDSLLEQSENSESRLIGIIERLPYAGKGG